MKHKTSKKTRKPHDLSGEIPYIEEGTAEEMRQSLAICLYVNDLLCFDEASELACMSYQEFQGLLSQEGVTLRTEDECLMKDLSSTQSHS